MNHYLSTSLSILLLLLLPLAVFGQEDKVTISGYVTDSSNGEVLIGANVYVENLEVGAITNLYGFYSITVPPEFYKIRYSYIGYQAKTKEIQLSANQKVDIELASNATLTEMVVTAEREDANVESIEMSKEKLSMDKIKTIPAMMGEVDVIKAIQLLPGISSTGEGQSGFNVRGGSVDQNMISLDEATVYNASHLLGFFSVFNPDAIKNVEVYKGGIPAEYGGRLSSVVDIRMNEGNKKRFTAKGGIGTVSSRLTLEGPLKKDESSFILAGRRTYVDQFLRFSADTSARDSKAFFYDLNAKINYKLGENDRVFISGYFGNDVFDFDGFGISWGNKTATARWNHVYNDKLFSNLTLIYSRYDYSLGQKEGIDAFKWESGINDVSAKLDFNYFFNTKNTMKFGLVSTRHDFEPGNVRGIGDETIFGALNLDNNFSLESALYFSNEHKISSRVTALYGVRYSLFNNMGEGTVYDYDENFQAVDSTSYKKGEFFNNYGNIEPRLGLKYTLAEGKSIKASYNRMAQYVHLASNGISSSPLDVWFPSSPNIKPQIADQVGLGYFFNMDNNTYECSVETYYKKIQNAVDFRDHAQLLLNQYLEGELRIGEARAYGAEFMVRKNKGRLTGWLGYTLAKTERKIAEINSGEWYNATWDKTHDASLVLTYDLGPRSTLSGNWIFGTGRAVTFPTGRFEYGGNVVPVYSDRNGERMPSYHRADLAYILKNKEKVGRKLFWDINFSIYNVYNRHNAYSINFNEDEETNEQVAELTYIFPILPSITWNFNF